MAVITRTFRGFFEQKFQEEKVNRYFGPGYFITEMAVRHHVRNDRPINFDDDDIEFLRQFPHDFWVTAKRARYDMLFKAVQDLHAKRHNEHKQKELVQTIVTAMETGEWSHLHGIVPDSTISWLMKNSPKLNRRQKEQDAEKLAHEYVRKHTAHIDEPKESVPFTLTSSNTAAVPRKQTFMAKPFLNRLYHKLETTPGEEFHPESGLQGRGKYGFDMTDPIEGKKNKQKILDDDGEEIEVSGSNLTSGLKFPSAEAISVNLGRFLSANASRIFGDLPEDVEWKEMPGKEDTWSVKFVKNQLLKKTEAQLRRSWKGKESDLRKEAKRIVDEELIQRAEKGEFRGPPIPGVTRQGFPITVKNGKLVNPPLYLPVEKRQIQKVVDGKVQTVTHDVPIVSPSHYVRELGQEESDYEHEYDNEGRERRKYNSDTGEPIYKVPEDQLRGHDKSFVHVPDEHYVKQKHMAPGALDANHDSEQTLHMTRGNPKWQEAWDKIFESQQKVDMDYNGRIKPDPNGAFYEDIAKGMKKCLWSNACGGATSHEREIFKHDLDGFHTYIVEKMLQHMDEPTLYTPEGRMAFAYSKITSILEKDQSKGGGPRRLRTINGGNDSRTVSFSGGGDANIEDDLMSRVASGGGKIRGTKKRGKGQRKWDTSGLSTPYNISNMRAALLQMQQDAKKADDVSDTAKKLSNHETGVHIIKMIRDGINTQIDFKIFVSNTLATLYKNSGMKEEDANETSERLIKSWIHEDGLRSSEQLMSAFQNHPLVKQAIEVGSGDAGKIHPVENDKESDADSQEAIRFLQSAFERMQNAGFDEEEMKDKLLAKPGEKYSAFVRELVAQNFGGVKNTTVMDRVQAEINRRFKLPAPAAAKAAREITPPAKATAQVGETTPPTKPTTTLKDRVAQRKSQNQATPEAQPVAPTATAPAPAAVAQQVPTPTESISELFAKKNWLGVAHHPHYLRTNSTALIEQKKKLLNHFHTNRDKYQPNEYASAVANLERSIRGEA